MDTYPFSSNAEAFDAYYGLEPQCPYNSMNILYTYRVLFQRQFFLHKMNGFFHTLYEVSKNLDKPILAILKEDDWSCLTFLQSLRFHFHSSEKRKPLDAVVEYIQNYKQESLQIVKETACICENVSDFVLLSYL